MKHDPTCSIDRLPASLMLQIEYGYNMCFEDEDPFMKLIETSLSFVMPAAQSGVWMMDTIPLRKSPCSRRLFGAIMNFLLVKYVPEWFPGAGFQRFAKASRKCANDLVNVPFEFVRRQMVRNQRSSACVRMLTSLKERRPVHTIHCFSLDQSKFSRRRRNCG